MEMPLLMIYWFNHATSLLLKHQLMPPQLQALIFKICHSMKWCRVFASGPSAHPPLNLAAALEFTSHSWKMFINPRKHPKSSMTMNPHLLHQLNMMDHMSCIWFINCRPWPTGLSPSSANADQPQCRYFLVPLPQMQHQTRLRSVSSPLSWGVFPPNGSPSKHSIGSPTTAHVPLAFGLSNSAHNYWTLPMGCGSSRTNSSKNTSRCLW